MKIVSTIKEIFVDMSLDSTVAGDDDVFNKKFVARPLADGFAFSQRGAVAMWRSKWGKRYGVID